MIHQYKSNGYNIVLDVNSGSVHVVDDIVYDIIPLFQDNSRKEIADKLSDRYDVDEINEACDEIQWQKAYLKKDKKYFYYFKRYDIII